MLKPVACWMLFGILAVSLNGCGKYASVTESSESANLQIRSRIVVPETSKGLLSILESGKSDLGVLRSVQAASMAGFKEFPNKVSAFAEIGSRSSRRFAQWEQFRDEQVSSDHLPESHTARPWATLPVQSLRLDAKALSILKRYSADHANAYVRVKVLESSLANALDSTRGSVAEKLEKARGELKAIDAARDSELKAHLMVLEREQATQVDIAAAENSGDSGAAEIRANSPDFAGLVIPQTPREIIDHKSRAAGSSDIMNAADFRGRIRDVEKSTDDAIRILRVSDDSPPTVPRIVKK